MNFYRWLVVGLLSAIFVKVCKPELIALWNDFMADFTKFKGWFSSL